MSIQPETTTQPAERQQKNGLGPSFAFFASFMNAVDEGVNEFNKDMTEIEESSDAYMECLDKVDIEATDYDAQIAECDALIE